MICEEKSILNIVQATQWKNEELKQANAMNGVPRAVLKKVTL